MTSAGPHTDVGTGAREQLLLGSLGVAGLEPGDATAGVEDLLLAGVERVALRAHVGVHRAGGGGAARDELRATGAGDLGGGVVRVDVLLHGVLSRVAGSPPRGCGRREPAPAGNCATRDNAGVIGGIPEPARPLPPACCGGGPASLSSTGRAASPPGRPAR